jgi:hypothetical protein
VSRLTAEVGLVIFDAQGGDIPSPMTKTVTLGATYGELAETARAGFAFEGWWTAVEGGVQVTPETRVQTLGDHTLFARWSRLAPESDIEFSGSAQFVSLSVFSDGKISVAFRDGSDRLSHAVYDPNGEVVVSATPVGNSVNFSASATLSNGNVAVAYSDANDGQSGKIIVVNSAGTVVVPPSKFANFANQFAIAPLSSGRMLVVHGPQPALTLIGADGVGAAPATIDPGMLALADAVLMADGRVFAAWVTSSFMPGQGGLGRYAIFDPEGGLVVGPASFDVGVGSSSGNFNLDVARFGNGDLGVVYLRDEKAHLAVINPAGAVTAPPFVIQASLAVSMTATAAPGGNLLFASVDAFNGNQPTWRVVDVTGVTRVGPLTFGSGGAALVSGQVESVTLANGTVVLGYAESATGSPPSRGLLRFLKASATLP